MISFITFQTYKHTSYITSISINGKTIASGDKDGTCKITEFAILNQVFSLKTHQNQILIQINTNTTLEAKLEQQPTAEKLISKTSVRSMHGTIKIGLSYVILKIVMAKHVLDVTPSSVDTF